MTDSMHDEDDMPDVPAGGRGNVKLQRWIDLLAALLSRSAPATFEQLAVDVPEYQMKLREIEAAPDAERRGKAEAGLKRTFERDKAELRTLGVPIDSIPDEHGNASGAYRLRRTEFYLPYLAITARSGERHQPPRVDHHFYHGLAKVAFEADELQAIVDAAVTLRSLGDRVLTAHINSALRKLACDLPVGATTPSRGEPWIVQSRARVDAEVYDELTDALYRRKTVTFDYHAFSSDEQARREVEPYGLFFLHGNWYLVGNDRVREGLRNFRLSRIRNPQVNPRNAQTADYNIPPTFRLREHASSRLAWEMGEDDAQQVTLRFDGTSGPTAAAARLGAAVPGDPTHRTFTVRRVGTFLRWTLSFAGEVTPVAPQAIVDQYREMLVGLGVRYEHEPLVTSAPATAADTTHPLLAPWEPAGAAAQFTRLLDLIPRIADGEEHALEEIAHEVGIDVPTLQRDIYSLVTRSDEPGGFVEGVSVLLESSTVSARSSHLRRPMRLTTRELRALQLGLAILRNHSTPDEHGAVGRARDRLEELVTGLPDDAGGAEIHGAALSAGVSEELLGTAREAIIGNRVLRIAYRKSGASEAELREVCPYALVASSGMYYVVAHCNRSDGLRVFRLDRIEAVELLDRGFARPEGFSLEEMLQRGRAFMPGAHESMTLHYSPRIARWIAEREGVPVGEDGALVLEHPVADREWAMRHVLQYGVDAEILSPPELREALRERVLQLHALASATAAQ